MDTLNRYLAVWAADGLTKAGRFVVPSQRAAGDEGVPRIVSAKVLAVDLYQWRSVNTFTLYVTLDLQFQGDPIAWSRGANDRFVTFHGQQGLPRFLLELATSP